MSHENFLMDSNLIPFKSKAETGSPEAILIIADAHWLGRGVPYDPIKAGEYYQRLADYPSKLKFVEYEYLYIILGDVAMMKKDYSKAVEEYKKSYKLFTEIHGSTAQYLMQDIGFLDRFNEALTFEKLAN